MNNQPIESADTKEKRTAYYCALVTNQPLRLNDKLFVTSLNDSFPKEVTYAKHPERNTYQLASKKTVYFESNEPIRSTTELTRAMALHANGDSHLVCRTFGEATIVHQKLLGDHMVYLFSVGIAKLIWLKTRIEIEIEHKLTLLRIELVFLRDLFKKYVL